MEAATSKVLRDKKGHAIIERPTAVKEHNLREKVEEEEGQGQEKKRQEEKRERREEKCRAENCCEKRTNKE